MAAAIAPIQLGAAINDAGFSVGGPAYRDTFVAHHDAATMESAMKMPALQPSQGVFDFARADEMVDWARANGKQVHGHVLIWCADEWDPAWVTGRSWTREELLAVMEDHIRTVMDHFEGRVSTWDVVNEPLDAGGGRRDCVWQRYIGDDWVAQAFRFAREADPSAELFLNEYAAEVPGPKYDALLALARDLPLDGVGLQHHTYGYAPLQYETEDVIGRLGALGLKVHVSELNVTTSQLPGSTSDRLAAQAQAYASIAAACATQPACFRITTWGFTDAFGWRPASEMAMPFDTAYAAKPAWYALRRAVGRADQPATPPPPAPSGPSVSQGPLTVAWAEAPGAVSYTLQHRDADDGGWSTLATGIPTRSFALPEREGTWTYRVRADAGAWSEPSRSVVVDRTPPLTPTVTGAWLRAPASAALEAVDPPLPDGSAGSGVAPGPPQVLGDGLHPVSGRLQDAAGNLSPEGGGVVRVDGQPPAVTLTCPRAIVRGQTVLGRWAATDAGSGVPAATGTVPLGPGGRATASVSDVVGMSASATCSYEVRHPLVLWTKRAPLHADGTLRLRLSCRSGAARACRAALRVGPGRSRSRLIPRGRAVTVLVRGLGRPGRYAVRAGRSRIGAISATG